MSSMMADMLPAQKTPERLQVVTTGAAGRLFFVDNIRWFLIVLVVMIHVAVTYAHIGDFWYFQDGMEVDVVSGVTLAALCCFIQAFSMGLFFFLAGAFVPGSYGRKGFRKFTIDRMVRLGVPTLFYMLFLHPLTVIIRDGFLGGLPVIIIVLMVLAMALYDYWNDCWRTKD